MKYFKDKSNKIYAFETDGTQDNFITKDLISILDNDVKTILNPSLTIDQLSAQFSIGIQLILDTAAQAKGFDNINTACIYAAAPNPFQVQGIAFLTWRGNVWAYCNGELAKVKAGTRAIPTFAQIVLELPVLK